MQGIGSDASYSASSRAGGIDTEAISNQLSKASESAFGLVSSMWETTSKVTPFASSASQIAVNYWGGFLL